MKICELNSNNFKKYGNIIKIDKKFRAATMDNFNYYIIDSIKTDSEITIGLLEVTKKVKEITQFEIHHLTEEVILPIKGEALLFLISPDILSPVKDDITVFKIKPGIGVKLYKNVWHAIPVIESESPFLCAILKEKTPEEDLNLTEIN